MMDIALPLPALVIFVASHFLPLGVDQMQTSLEGHQVTWNRNEAGEWQPEVPNQLGGKTTFQVEGRKVKVVPQGKPYYTVNVDDYLELPAETTPDYWAKVKALKIKHTAFGSDVSVRRGKNQVSFSQTKGQLSLNPVIISWKEPAKTEEATKEDATQEEEAAP